MTGTFSKIENSSYYLTPVIAILNMQAYLAQLVERKTFNLVVVGSSPTVGISLVDLINSDEKVSFVIVF